MRVLGFLLTLVMVSWSDSAAALDPLQPPFRYARTTWGVEDGLVFGNIHALAQDHEGYLWLGTDDGLVRFDGTEFVPWPNESTQSTRLVRAIVVAGDGSLWIGGRGVTRILGGHITTFGESDGVAALTVVTMAVGSDGAIWAGGPDGVIRFRNGRWDHPLSGTELGGTPVSRLYADQHGDLWVSGSLGTFRWRSDGGGLERLTTYSTSSISTDLDGGVWLADVRHGVHRVSLKPTAIGRFAGEQGIRLLRDRDGSLWIGTPSRGVWRRSGNRMPPAHETLISLDASAAPLGVSAMLEDREGNLWIAGGTGLTRISDSDVTMIGDREGLPAAEIAALGVTCDRRVWAATSRGLFSVGVASPGRFSVRRELRGAISALHVDRRDRLWLATVYRQVGQYEVGTFEHGRFVRVPLPRNTLSGPVSAMTIDREHALWMCDQLQGLLRWREGRVDRFDTIGDLGHVTCTSAEEDDAHRRWFGLSTGGVVSFEDGEFHTFRAASDASGLAPGEPVTVHIGTSGTVWLGTRRGLLRFVNERMVPVARASDFPTLITSGLVEDGQGHIWTGANVGLVRISTVKADTPEFRIFGQGHGLVGVVSSSARPSAVRSADGRLWFATSRGLAMIDPNRLRTRRGTGEARIDAVRANGRSLSLAPSIGISPGTTRLEIRYGALNLSAPESTRFRYRLDGVDADWIDAGTRREAFYTNLAPGAYTFNVTASDREGRWEGPAARVAVDVQPRFRQTGWFYALIGSAGALLVAGLWWLRLRVVKGRFRSILAERARVAREIHDTLLQSLGSVAIELEAVTAQLPGAPPESIDTLMDLRRRVTASVRETRDSIERLRAVRSDRRDLLDSLSALSASCDAQGTTACTLKLLGKYQPCSPLAEEQLLRIVQEAVSNARRHGRARRIEIELEYQADSLLLCVTDDGSGFNWDDSSSGMVSGHWGIASMRERAAIIGASFHIETRVAEGTQVLVVAPLNSDVYAN